MIVEKVKKIKETPQKEKETQLKGREEYYFFPDKGKTIKATSLEEALEKIKCQ